MNESENESGNETENETLKKYELKKEADILIPYYSSKNKFELSDEIKNEHETHKDYLNNVLQNINMIILFEGNEKLKYKILRILIYIFSIIIFLFTIYIIMFISILSLINPMIILILCLFVLKFEINLIFNLYLKIKENSKINRIENQIKIENSKNIQKYFYKWKLSLDATWINLKIYLINNELTENDINKLKKSDVLNEKLLNDSFFDI